MPRRDQARSTDRTRLHDFDDGGIEESQIGRSAAAALVDDPVLELRQTAAWALGQHSLSGSHRAVLLSEFKDEDALVRKRAIEKFGINSDPRELDPDMNAVPHLLAALQDTDASVRQQAASVLGNYLCALRRFGELHPRPETMSPSERASATDIAAALAEVFKNSKEAEQVRCAAAFPLFLNHENRRI